jgi:hypothetical protein
VRQQGAGGGPAEGRMAYVGMVCNPGPEWPWPDEEPGPMRARYLSGLYPLEDFAPLGNRHDLTYLRFTRLRLDDDVVLRQGR